ncbi:DUF6710 family protein [Halomonas elongata]|uniref:DUF6710 family protein n=2 Tax=Halomonas elongata (strain ATCC 33173 / DSM 2581 / NBRC 15536 / NCIMB 2198 / 1H9) TaxID=768066 RepID=A0ABZ0T6B8_HALED|nr:DUF6710 family protein [Halomonas elongata]WBF17731.1 hypothetical protein LM502_16895 [Halomonas elongata]WPU46573.1 DUF6710 family protein [Halomonas elongata DSM 2581]
MESKRSGRRERFENVMKVARDVANQDPHSLSTVVRWVAYPLQGRVINSVVMSDKNCAREGYTLVDHLSVPGLSVIDDNGTKACDLFRKSEKEFQVILGKDPVLAGPWGKGSTVTAMAHCGHGKSNGDWRQDLNHKVTMVLPFGVCVVGGGNHSLSAGIANSEGRVVTKESIDIALLYDYVRYDGESFLRTSDDIVLRTPDDEEIGMLFEIGRLMKDLDVRYDALEGSADDNELNAGNALDWFYKVLINGEDTGQNLTESGLTRTLMQAGLQPGSDEWISVGCGNKPITRQSRSGEKQEIYFKNYHRRRTVDRFEDIIFEHAMLDPDAD